MSEEQVIKKDPQEMTEEFEEVKEDIEAVEEDLAVVKEDLEEAISELEETREEFEEVKEEVEEVKHDLEETKEEFEEQITKVVEDLKAQLESTSQKNINLQTEIIKSNKDVDSLKRSSSLGSKLCKTLVTGMSAAALTLSGISLSNSSQSQAVNNTYITRPQNPFGIKYVESDVQVDQPEPVVAQDKQDIEDLHDIISVLETKLDEASKLNKEQEDRIKDLEQNRFLSQGNVGKLANKITDLEKKVDEDLDTEKRRLTYWVNELKKGHNTQETAISQLKEKLHQLIEKIKEKNLVEGL